MCIHQTHGSEQAPPRWFGFQSILVASVMLAIWWALAQSQTTYPLILPVLGSVAGALGSHWAIRRNRPVTDGACRFSAGAGAIVSLAHVAIAIYNSNELIHREEFWDDLFYAAFALVMCTVAAMSFGVVFGPILAFVDSNYRNRLPQSTKIRTLRTLESAMFRGATGGALALLSVTFIVTASPILSIIFFPFWILGAVCGTIAGRAGLCTRLGPFYWGSFAGMVIGLVGAGILHIWIGPWGPIVL